MDESPDRLLDGYRARIDAIDDQLIALLKDRIGIVGQVAALKRREWPAACHIRSGREGRMHQRIAAAFADSEFAPQAALAIWREIIGASTHRESPLHIVTVGSHLTGLARDYFGSTAEVAHSESIHAALAAMASKRFNILIAPREMLGVVAMQAPHCKLFAALPLITDTPEAFALAEITPEPSGHDVSYFYEQGNVTSQPGFNDHKPGAVWLGAHPMPIRL